MTCCSEGLPLLAAHPLVSSHGATEAQRVLSGELQGAGGVWFAGAWCGYGFHEDGITSAVAVVRKLCGSSASTRSPLALWLCAKYCLRWYRGHLGEPGTGRPPQALHIVCLPTRIPRGV